MSYFNLKILHVGILPHCTAKLDAQFPGIYSVEFIAGGKMFFGVDKQPGFILDYPAVFWHHPDHSYQYGAIDADGWDHHYVLMEGERAKSLIELGFFNLSNQFFFPVKNVPYIDMLFHTIHRKFQELPHGELIYGEILIELERILCFLIKEKISSVQENYFYSSQFRNLANRIAQLPQQPWDWIHEARMMNLSLSHFRRLFKLINGVSPHEYVLSWRLKHAAHNLRESHKTIKEIARFYGFEDVGYFCRLFKKKFGLSPKKYRMLV